MSETTLQCAADLLEAGMRIMNERGLQQCREAVVQFDGYDNLYAVCAIGAMLLGAGEAIDSPYIGTLEAIRRIADKCPSINADSGFAASDGQQLTIAYAIPRLNDGSRDGGFEPHTLPEILAWLRARAAEAT